MAKIECRFDILAGPGKFDLMVALLDSSEQLPRVVDFTLRLRSENAPPWIDSSRECAILMPLEIMGMMRADGTGENWHVDGEYPKPPRYRFAFKAYYNLRTRKGTLTLFV